MTIAILPTKFSLSQQPSGRSGRQLAEYDTSAIGRGMQVAGRGLASLGQDLSSVSMDMQRRQVEAKKRLTATEGIAADGGATREMNDFVRGFDQDGDYSTFGQRADKGLSDIKARYAGKITDKQARQTWEADYDRRAEAARNRIADLGETKVREARLVDAKTGLEGYQSIIADTDATEEDRARAKGDAEASIAVLQQSGLIDPSTADTWRDSIVKGGQFVFGQREIEKDPSVLTRRPTADASLPVEARALLDTIAGTESPDYNTMNGGEKFSDYTDHPRRIGKGGTATAAGRYQFVEGTWDRAAKAVGASDFSPGNQDKAAWWLAQADYKANTGRDLLTDLRSKDPNTIAGVRSALSSTWEGLKSLDDNKFNAKLEAGPVKRPDWYLAQSPEKQLQLENMAMAQDRQVAAAAAAQSKADASQAVDDFQLRIAVADPTLTQQQILEDPRIDNGQRASLVEKFTAASKDSLAIAQAMPKFADGTLGNSVDPYSTEGRKIVDGVSDQITKLVPEDKQAGATEELIRQTGLVPQSTFNGIRAGLSSTDISEVERAAQQAVRISQINPAALSRRDGGATVQQAADDFSYYVNNLNMTPTQAAQRMANANNPDAIRERKALEPAAKEFRKTIDGQDLGALFDNSNIPFNDPKVGFTEGQALGIKAEYAAIAEEQFYLANGDTNLAMNRAKQEMQRLYGVTEITGPKVVMKYPPERYWPQQKPEGINEAVFGNPYGWVDKQLSDDLIALDPNIPKAAASARLPPGRSGMAAAPEAPRVDMSKIQFVTTPETDRMVKRGEMPAYQVMYTDENGVLQTIPGKLWRPDATRINEKNSAMDKTEQDQTMKRARELQADEGKRAEMQNADDAGRSANLDAFLDGPSTTGIDKVQEAAGPKGKFDGMVENGNIDLAKRPQVKNEDGTVSTVRSMSFEEDGQEVLVPTVSPDGKILSDDDAIALYHETGQFLGKFKTADQADKYAKALHKAQAKFYGVDGD